VIPVEGALKIYATLEEEEEQLRVLETIVPGTKVRIVAFNNSNVYVDDNEYTVGVGGVLESATALELPDEGTYKFVAYSLNTTTSTPTYAASIGPYSADGADDVLCGSLTTAVSEGVNTVPIKMYHMFSKVTVIATTTSLGGTPPINEITAALSGYEANLDVPNAAFAKGTAEDQTMNWQPFSASTTVTSDERKVYAGGEANTYITIPSVKINGTAYVGLAPAQFAKLLEPGKRYTLTVAFKNLEFAGSNIYWKAVANGPQAPGYLTFDGAGETTNQMYQGVFFLWGSLVGVSPAGNVNVALSIVEKVYIPTYNSGSPSWSTDNIAVDDILNISDGFPPSPLDPAGTYLIDDERNTLDYWNVRKGDICRYLSENGYGPGGRYRMPVGYEYTGTMMPYGEKANYDDSNWTKAGIFSSSAVNVSSTYDDGTFSISGGSSHNSGVVFPASGMKGSNVWPTMQSKETRLVGVGVSCTYWSASMYGEYGVAPQVLRGVFILAINSSEISAGSSPAYMDNSMSISRYLHAIRCVKN
jgi:hypothetical protein